MVALVRRLVVAVILVVWFFPPAGSARAAEIPSPSSGPVVARTTTPAGPVRSAPATPTSTELRRYAEREEEARELERFEGGGRISASTTTIIIILLLVIIILILV